MPGYKHGAPNGAFRLGASSLPLRFQVECLDLFPQNDHFPPHEKPHPHQLELSPNDFRPILLLVYEIDTLAARNAYRGSARDGGGAGPL